MNEKLETFLVWSFMIGGFTIGALGIVGGVWFLISKI